MKKGFTLIELLVVVLIIGILASVAMPQYQRVVAKSRATEATQFGKTWAKAQNIYYLENGRYTQDFEDLSIELPSLKYFEIEDHAYGSQYLKLKPGSNNVVNFAVIDFSISHDGQVYGCCYGEGSGTEGAPTCRQIMPCGSSQCSL